LGITIRVSTFSRKSWIPFSAWIARRLPSKENAESRRDGQDAHGRAISATTGAAPVPVPPPSPTVMNTMSVSFRASSISARDPRPPVGRSRDRSRAQTAGQLATDVQFKVGLTDQESLRVGVGAMNSMLRRPAATMRFTALTPPPPHRSL